MSRGLCSVPGAHTDSSVAAAWEKAAWVIQSVKAAAHSTSRYAAAGQTSTLSERSLTKYFLEGHALLHSLLFPRVGSPALLPNSCQASDSLNPYAFS